MNDFFVAIKNSAEAVEPKESVESAHSACSGDDSMEEVRKCEYTTPAFKSIKRRDSFNENAGLNKIQNKTKKKNCFGF